MLRVVCVEEDGTIYNSGYSHFPSVHNLVFDLVKLAKSKLFLINLGLDSLRVAEFYVFQNSLTTITGRSD